MGDDDIPVGKLTQEEVKRMKEMLAGYEAMGVFARWSFWIVTFLSALAVGAYNLLGLNHDWHQK